MGGHVFVLGVSIWSLSTILIFDFGIVSTMLYTAKPTHVVTPIQQSPVLRGHQSYKAIFSLSQRWPLNTGLVVLYGSFHN